MHEHLHLSHSRLDDCDMNNRRRSVVSPRIFALLAFLALAALAMPPPARAQGQPPPNVSQPSRPAPQAPLPTSTFLGGVPSGTPTNAVEKITIVAAIVRAMEHNLGVLVAEHAVGRAQGARWRALSELLPNVNARVGETRQQINLAAFGFGGGPGSPFGDIPTIIGPFNVFDARIYLSQSVLNFGAL